MGITEEDYKKTKALVEDDVIKFVRNAFEGLRYRNNTMVSYSLVIHELQKQLIEHRTLAILYEKIVKLKKD